MKRILLTLLLSASICVGFAQKTPSKAIGWDIAVSPGVALSRYYGSSSKFVLGAETRIQQNFGYNFAWMASFGYTHFSALENGYFSLKGGIKAYLEPKVYLGAEIGIGEYSQGGEAFIFSPSVGMLFGKRWDLALKYESFSEFNFPDSQLALRIGFKLSK